MFKLSIQVVYVLTVSVYCPWVPGSNPIVGGKFYNFSWFSPSCMFFFLSFLVSKFNQLYFHGFNFFGQAHNSENRKFCETSRKFAKSANIEAPRTCMYTVNMVVIIFSEKIRSAHRDLNSDPPGPKPCPVTTRPRELLRQERLYLIQFPLVELPFLPTVNTADC